jgi:hypothetical protein
MSSITSRLFVLLLIISAASATSIETVSYGGNIYYHATNNGSIEPQTFFNRTDLFNGANISDALSRDVLSFGFALAYLNNGSITPITLQGLPSYNIYGYSDNSTYWRGEINRSFTLGSRTVQVSLNYRQETFDDFINETWRLTLSGSYTAPNNVWYVESIENIRFLDHITFGNESMQTGGWLNASYDMDNVTIIKIANWGSTWGWDYRLDRGRYGNKLIVRNGKVYIGLNLGKTLSSTTMFGLQKIDEGECTVTCTGPGDSVAIEENYVGNSNTQVTTPNATAGVRWVVNSISDPPGDCSLGYACYMGCYARNPYGTITSYPIITEPGVSGSSLWMTLSTLNASNGGYGSSPKTARTAYQPTKNQWYDFQVLNLGRYARAALVHNVRCQMDNPGTTFTVAGFDIIAPLLGSCDFGGGVVLSLATNNSILSVPSTNGSLAYANVTPNCSYGTPIGAVLNGTAFGLVNMTGMRLNKTGTAWNTSWYSQNTPWGFQSVPYPELANGTKYQLCTAANGTNTTSTGGYKDSNWSATPWCYAFSLNIVSNPPVITFLNFSNYSQQGFLVNFSGFETDGVALSTCIFSFNATGSFVNETQIPISGVTNSCLQNKSFPFPGAYGVRLWVNNSGNVFAMSAATVLITPSGPQLNDYAIPLGIAIAGGALGYWAYRRARR